MGHLYTEKWFEIGSIAHTFVRKSSKHMKFEIAGGVAEIQQLQSFFLGSYLLGNIVHYYSALALNMAHMDLPPELSKKTLTFYIF